MQLDLLVILVLILTLLDQLVLKAQPAQLDLKVLMGTLGLLGHVVIRVPILTLLVLRDLKARKVIRAQLVKTATMVQPAQRDHKERQEIPAQLVELGKPVSQAQPDLVVQMEMTALLDQLAQPDQQEILVHQAEQVKLA